MLMAEVKVNPEFMRLVDSPPPLTLASLLKVKDYCH
jgi:hypothetical protein